jgi:hypothetical protein
MDAALTAVAGQLTTAAGSLSTQVAAVAGVGIGVGLLIFGITLLVRTFKRTAK